MTLEELKKLYAEKGATTRREIQTEQGVQYQDDAIDYGNGYGAFETADEETGAKSLGGFTKKDGDYISFFDPTGKMLGSQKWNKSDFQMLKEDLGPIAMMALSGYLGGIPLGETGLTAANALGAANAVKNKDPLAFLSSTSGAFDTAGFDLNGLNAKDVLKYANMATNLASGDPIKMMQTLPGLTNSFGGFDVNPKDFTEGYFLPGGEGWIDPSSKTEGVTGSGYYDEITGAYIKDPLGGLQNPLSSTVGNLDPNQKWEYNMTKPGVWTNDAGEEIDLTYLPNTEKVMTGAEIMRNAGALPKTSGSNTKTAAKPDTKTTATTNQPDWATILGLLGSMGGQQTTSTAPSQDPYADIKSFEDLGYGELFGPDLNTSIEQRKKTEKR
jgi:hypothetical protein